MALKIRLKRMGKRNLPFYRVVVVDSRWRRDGKTIADIGWYDPVKQPAQISFKENEIYHWLENGAQMSETIRALFKREGIIDRFRSGEYKSILKQANESGSVVVVKEAAADSGQPKVQSPTQPLAEQPKEPQVAAASESDTTTEPDE